MSTSRQLELCEGTGHHCWYSGTIIGFRGVFDHCITCGTPRTAAVTVRLPEKDCE